MCDVGCCLYVFFLFKCNDKSVLVFSILRLSIICVGAQQHFMSQISTARPMCALFFSHRGDEDRDKPEERRCCCC